MRTFFDDLVIDGRGGGGKGGGASHVATEAPNTLKSRAIAKFVDLLCEGEIGGLVDGLKSIYLDKVPVENPDGSLNFKGYSNQIMVGTSSQGYLPGFPSVTDEHDVNRRVRADTPVIYTTNGNKLDAVIVTINIPALSIQDKANGDLNGYSLTLGIDVRNISAPGSTWVTKVLGDYISGKNTSPYERSYEIQLDDPGQYLVRVRRLSYDHDDQSEIQDKLFFGHVTEVQNHKVAYSDSAVMGTVLDAEQFGSTIPGRESEIYGKLIQYPSNYSPSTGVYTGFWDGTWGYGFCNNPAWVFRDICLNPRYGIGMREEFIDKWGLYQMAQYCDQTVPDGRGGTERRFVFNGYMPTQTDAYKVLQSIASMMRAIVFYSAGAVVVRQDAPQQPTKLYTLANIKGDFNYSGTSLKARHNSAVVKFKNPLIGYDDDFVVYEDRASIIKYGDNPLEIQAYGTTSPGQAYRIAKWAVLTDQMQQDTVQFNTGFDTSDVLPGDVIEIADPAYATADFGGRILNVSADGYYVTLDRPVTLTGATAPSLHFTLLTGAFDDVANMDNTNRVARRKVTYWTANVISIDPVTNLARLSSPIPADRRPIVNGELIPIIWIFSKDELKPRPFKVQSVKEGDLKGEYKITALEYSVQKFIDLDEDFSVVPVSENYSDLPSTTYCVPPSNLKSSFTTYYVNGALQATIDIDWEKSPDQFLAGYVLSYKRNDDNWITKEITGELHDTLRNVLPGKYHFTLRATSRFGVSSVLLTHDLDVQDNAAAGRTLITSIVSNLGNAVFTEPAAVVRWTSTSISQSSITDDIGVIVNQAPPIPATVGFTRQSGSNYTQQDGTIYTPQGGLTGGMTSSGSVAQVDTAIPGAPFYRLVGNFLAGDVVRVRIGYTEFTVTLTGTNPISQVLASQQVRDKINLDGRYSAAYSPFNGRTVISFLTNTSNASGTQADQDPLFKRYVIRVYNAGTSALLRTEYASERIYSYTYEKNVQDGGPIRNLRFDVAVEDIYGNVSLFKQQAISNPSPTWQAAAITPGLGTITLVFPTPIDPDYVGVVVYMSQTSGFTPNSGNLVWQNSGNPVIPGAMGYTYYLRYGYYDTFGIAGVTLSGEVAVTVGDMDTAAGGITPPAVPTGLSLSSASVPDAVTGIPQTTLTAQWNKNTETNLAGYEVQITDPATNETISRAGISGNALEKFTWTVRANATYLVRVRAVDRWGNRSAYCTAVGLLSAKDSTPPSAPTSVSAVTSFKNIFVSWTNPSDGDLDKVEIWENTTNNSGTATRLTTLAARPSALGNYVRTVPDATTRYYWIKAVDTSGNVSAFSTGTGAVTPPIQVTSTEITDASIGIAKFAAGLQPVGVVYSETGATGLNGTSPATSGYTVFNTYDSQTYRYVSGSPPSAVWTNATPAVNITGTITSAQIANGAVGIAQIAAGYTMPQVVSKANINDGTVTGAINSQAFNATNGVMYRNTTGTATGWLPNVQPAAQISGTLTSSQIADLDAAKVTGQIVGTQIASDAITTPKIFAGAITTAKIAALAVTANEIAANTITAAKIAADTITANEIAANAITSNELAANSVIAGKIAAGVITANEIAAGAITASKLSVTSLENLIVNGDVADGTLAAFSRSTAPSGSSIGVAFNGSGTWPSKYGMIFTRGGTAGEMSIVLHPTSFDDTTMAGGITSALNDEYYFEAIVYQTVASTMQIDAIVRINGTATSQLACTAGTNTTVASNYLTASATSTTFSRITGSFRNATGTGKVFFRVTHSNNTSGNLGYIWNIVVKRRNVGEMIVDGTITGTKLVAQTITATQIATDTITATQIAAGAITASELAANSVIAGKIAAGVITATEIAVGAITATQMSIGSLDNLIANPNGEIAYTSGYPSLGLFNAGTGNAYNGAWVRRIVTPTTGEVSIVLGSAPCAPGDSFYFETWVKAIVNAPNMGAYLFFLDAAGGAVTGTNYVNTASSSASWTKVMASATAPANAAEVRFYVYQNTVAGTGYFDGLYARKMLTGSLVVDGSITASKIQALSITAALIAAGTITGDRIAGATITAGNIATDTITATQIAAGAITASELAVGAVTADRIAAGAVTATKISIGNTDNVITDGDMRDNAWWMDAGTFPAGGVGIGAYVGDVSASGWVDRRAFYIQPGTFDFYSKMFNVEPGASYKISARIYTASGFSGYIQPLIHMPSYQWFSLKHGFAVTPSTNNAGNAIVAAGDTGVAPLEWTITNPVGISSNNNSQWQFRFVGNFTGGYGVVSVKIVRVSDNTLIQDGAVTTTKIVANAVTAAKIAAGSITTDKLAVGSPTNMLTGTDPGPEPFAWMVGTGGSIYNPQGATFLGPAGPAANTKTCARAADAHGATWDIGDRSVVTCYQTNAPTTDFVQWVLSRRTSAATAAADNPFWPIQAGKTYEFSIYAQTASCSADVVLHFFDVSGNLLTAPQNGWAAVGNPGVGNDLTSYVRLVARGLAPTNATRAYLGIRKTNNGNNSWLMFCRPQFGEVPANSTQIMPWTPPGMTHIDGASIVTGSITAAQIQAGSITTDKLAAGTITVGLTIGSAGKIILDGANNRILIYD